MEAEAQRAQLQIKHDQVHAAAMQKLARRWQSRATAVPRTAPEPASAGEHGAYGGSVCLTISLTGSAGR